MLEFTMALKAAANDIGKVGCATKQLIWIRIPWSAPGHASCGSGYVRFRLPSTLISQSAEMALSLRGRPHRRTWLFMRRSRGHCVNVPAFADWDGRKGDTRGERGVSSLKGQSACHAHKRHMASTALTTYYSSLTRYCNLMPSPGRPGDGVQIWGCPENSSGTRPHPSYFRLVQHCFGHKADGTRTSDQCTWTLTAGSGLACFAAVRAWLAMLVCFATGPSVLAPVLACGVTPAVRAHGRDATCIYLTSPDCQHA